MELTLILIMATAVNENVRLRASHVYNICFVYFQDMKCYLTLLDLLAHNNLHDGKICYSCTQPVGKHPPQYGNLLFQ